MTKIFDKIEDNIEVLFTFLNKETTSTKENTAQVVIAFTMFLVVFSSMAYVSTLMIGA